MILISRRRLLLIPAILVALSAVVTAQSGRRGPTKSPKPDPQPVPSTTQSETEPKTSARIQLLVAVDELSGFDRMPLATSDTVLETCVQRLAAAAKDVAAVPALRRMTRAEAVQAAKAETARYVVWLQVGNERDDYGAEVSSQSNRVYVNYTIFEPASAKIKKSGRAQHNTGNVGNVGVTIPSRGAVQSDYEIKETARQAADRILDAFQIRRGGWLR
jgi:predicted CoA-binding protein